MVTPNAEASSTASAALDDLPAVPDDDQKLVIPRKIANSEPLTDQDLSTVRTFYLREPDTSIQYVTAARLYGGAALRSQIETVEADTKPAAITSLMAMLPDDVTSLVQASSIPIVTLGPSAVQSVAHTKALTLVAQRVSTSWPIVEASARWAKDTDLVWHSPGLHELRSHVMTQLNNAGVPIPDDTPWLPSTNMATVQAAGTEIVLGYETGIRRIGVTHNDDVTTFPLNPSTPKLFNSPRSPSSAKTRNLIAELIELDRYMHVSACEIMAMGWEAALSRIGMMATRHNPNLANRATFEAGRVIDADMAKRVNVTKLVTPCLLYTSPSPRDKRQSRMPSSA